MIYEKKDFEVLEVCSVKLFVFPHKKEKIIFQAKILIA